MSPVKTPQERYFMMKAMIPILRKVISNTNDKKSPPKRHPFKGTLEIRKYKRQKLQAEVGNERTNDKFGNGIAHNIQDAFIPVPMFFIKAKGEFDGSQDEYEHGKSPGTQVLKYGFDNFNHHDDSLKLDADGYVRQIVYEDI